MTRVWRALAIVFCLSVLWIVPILVLSMRKDPPLRLLAISTLVFWVVLGVLFRYLVRQSKEERDAAALQPLPEYARRFLRRVPTLGKLYIFTGAASFLLGVKAERNKEIFFIVGAGVWFFAAYLLYLAKRTKHLRE